MLNLWRNILQSRLNYHSKSVQSTCIVEQIAWFKFEEMAKYISEKSR